MDNQYLELFIHGRVQGVYYRKTIQSYANKNNVTGFVENLKNGSVHIIALGEKKNLDNFIKLCRKGSFLSSVAKIEHEHKKSYKEAFNEFSIIKQDSFLTDQIHSFSQLKKYIMTKKQTSEKMTVPEHIVIIPNGNRTWAKKRGLDAWSGYWETYKNLDSIVKEAGELGISHLTLWGFSTENWKRNNDEIEELFKVISLILEKLEKKLIIEKIQFNHFGRKDRLPEKIVASINNLEKATENFKGRSINIALDYGGRDEIIRTINQLLKSGKQEITEQEFSDILDTKNVPDPDLIIRTANEKRMSGMMPWQATYSEYYFTDIYFPDFKGTDLRTAILDFSKRKRTFGGDIDKNKKTN